MAMVQQKSLPWHPCLLARDCPFHVREPQAELSALCRRGGWWCPGHYGWPGCPGAPEMAQGILHHWSPKTSQLSFQDAVTSLNPVIPSSPATFGHQHSVSLLSAIKTLWTPRACSDPHNTRKPHLEGCEHTVPAWVPKSSAMGFPGATLRKG